MGKKISSILALIFIIFIVQGKASASELIITPKKDLLPIYDNRDGVLTEIGKMRSGEPMIALQDYGENWWQIKFANAYGYVNKADVHIQNNLKVPARNKQANTNNVVLIHKDADVVDNSSGALKKFAVVKAGFRYPILADFGSWWKIDVGGRVGFLHKTATTPDKGVRVLMYHHILTAKEKADSPFANRNTTTIDTQFNEQMDYLKKSGFTTISTKDLEGYLNKRVNLPAKSIVITLDDGNISSRIYAYPKLKELGFTADQFIITSRIPNKPHTFDHQKLHFLSQQEMDEMTDVFNYYGHTHALHSLTSKNESYVIAKDRKFVKTDLLLNRKILNNMSYLAYPFGKYNNDTLKIMRETGFTMAYTTQQGFAKLGVNKLLIPRMGIEPNLPIKDFMKIVDTGMPVTKPVKPVKPSPKPNPDGLFTDVAKTDDFYDAVKSLTDRGIIKGYPNGSFKPYNGVTRGQAAKILASVLNLDMKNVENPGFVDVKETDEYYKPIAALVKEGIISGYPADKTFKPANQLTRAQMAKIISLGFKLDGETLTDTRFTDVKASDAFSGYVQSLLTNGITKGTTATTFSPANTVTRGQLALFVTRSEAVVKNRPAEKEEEVPDVLEEEVLTGNIIAESFVSVDELSYSTNMKLVEGKFAQDVEQLTVEWFNEADEVLLTGSLLAMNADTDEVTMFYDASFDYEAEGLWEIEGTFADKPVRVKFTVTFINGKEVSAEINQQ